MRSLAAGAEIAAKEVINARVVADAKTTKQSNTEDRSTYPLTNLL
jgi:hypothetical protein